MTQLVLPAFALRTVDAYEAWLDDAGRTEPWPPTRESFDRFCAEHPATEDADAVWAAYGNGPFHVVEASGITRRVY